LQPKQVKMFIEWSFLDFKFLV